MLLVIPNLLNTAQLKQLKALLNNAEFVDGKQTAAGHARDIKNNLQVDNRHGTGEQAAEMVVKLLSGNKQFLDATRPKKIHKPLISRYIEGMSYGDHLDKPFMGRNQGTRTDISTTVFLNNADEYEGGELVIYSDYGEIRKKPGAGDVILYPSTTIHHVEPVKAGERLVAVTWIESRVRSAEKRKILYDMAQAVGTPEEGFSVTEKGRVFETCYHNLVRMWSDN